MSHIAISKYIIFQTLNLTLTTPINLSIRVFVDTFDTYNLEIEILTILRRRRRHRSQRVLY